MYRVLLSIILGEREPRFAYTDRRTGGQTDRVKLLSHLFMITKSAERRSGNSSHLLTCLSSSADAAIPEDPAGVSAWAPGRWRMGAGMGPCRGREAVRYLGYLYPPSRVARGRGGSVGFCWWSWEEPGRAERLSFSSSSSFFFLSSLFDLGDRAVQAVWSLPLRCAPAPSLGFSERRGTPPTYSLALRGRWGGN